MRNTPFPKGALLFAAAATIAAATAVALGVETVALVRASPVAGALGARLGAALAAGGVAVAAGLAFVLHAGSARLAAAEDLVRRLGEEDALLGVSNRRGFLRVLDAAAGAARAGRDRFALLVVDIDRFKDVNDALGPEAGDALLRAVVQRLAAALRPGDRLARLGGDEFAVLRPGIGERRDGEALAGQLVTLFDRPFLLGDRPAHVTASIGVAAAPDDAGSPEDILRRAQEALARAKRDGGARYSVFEPLDGREAALRREIERDLKPAILEDRLDLAYQPIFDANTREIVGVEALLRWRPDGRAALPPDLVVAVAEEKGLISQLGQLVLRKACVAATAWPRARVAVNVSPSQFRQPDFVAQVAKVLMETGFDPNRLELELTEGVVVTDADLAERAMTSLRAMGVRMALDDFGIGYSSLIYLRRFPFDKIKIDRSFLESLEPRGEGYVLLESVVRLGQALGLTVTAEGVETLEQLRLLQRLGCHELQGFMLGKPAPAAEIGAMLADAQDRQETERLAVA